MGPRPEDRPYPSDTHLRTKYYSLLWIFQLETDPLLKPLTPRTIVMLARPYFSVSVEQRSPPSEVISTIYESDTLFSIFECRNVKLTPCVPL